MIEDAKDLHQERFYVFERAARGRFEPTAPRQWTIDECEGFLIAAVLPALERITLEDTLPIRIVGRNDGLFVGGTCEETEHGFVIRLPPNRRRPWCVIHEAVHAAMFDEGHGPRFAETVIRLWSTLLEWPESELSRLLTDATNDRCEEVV